MWIFGKKKESLLSEIRRITKEGREKTIKDTVKELIEDMKFCAKRGRTCAHTYVEEDIKDEVLKIMREKGFDVELVDGRRYEFEDEHIDECESYIYVRW